MNDEFDPWLSYCLNASHSYPGPCEAEWFFEPSLGAFKTYVCPEHGPVSMRVIVSTASS